MKRQRWEIPRKNLRAYFDPATFPFATTEELANLDGVIGQERAVRAMEFGLQIQGRGYNIYVSGVPGIGKNAIVKGMIKAAAAKQPAPDDWCYVLNFRDLNKPRALNLPAGKAREFQRDMDHLVASLREDLTRVFRSAEYQHQREVLEASSSKARNMLTRKLKQQARNYGVQITTTQGGLFASLLFKSKPSTGKEDEPHQPHPKMVRNDVHKEKELNTLIRTHLQQVHTLQNEANQKIRQLNRQVALRASEPRFAALREKYRGMPKVLDHLHAVEEDVLDKLDDFLADLQPPADNGSVGRESGRRPMSRYAVNVIVDNGQLQGAPVIEEPNPTYTNLVGHSGRVASFGALYADFTLIRAGSLLRANGGYLLLNTSDVLRDATAWDALKRTLERQEVAIEDIGEPNGFIAPTGLNPEPIPLQLRVVLVGTPTLHAQLHVDDENFRKLFKVKVDFDVQYNCGGEAPVQYGRFIARLCRDEGLLHFEGEAVAAVLEQACRWVDHQRKLSLRFGDLADLIREASYWAYQEGCTYVARPHVRRAVEARIYRSNLAAERMRELIVEGALKVDIAGAVVGQINALSLYDAGDFAFGLPARVTARVFLGEAGIVDIEREVDLSEETHSKGVLILSGYLGGLYAHEVPLSFSASLCFEQSYSEVEGDSASAAELVALLSALAELPIDQGIALTGSVNQRGELQAVSGINEKIEGFYAVCKTLGLTGNQGVVIPRQNIAHLVLNEDVVEAVSSGMFHIHAVSTVDEAIEILVGRPAGELQPDGVYPSGSVNAIALKRLQDMHERLRLEKRSRTPRKSAFPRRPPLP